MEKGSRKYLRFYSWINGGKDLLKLLLEGVEKGSLLIGGCGRCTLLHIPKGEPPHMGHVREGSRGLVRGKRVWRDPPPLMEKRRLLLLDLSPSFALSHTPPPHGPSQPYLIPNEHDSLLPHPWGPKRLQFCELALIMLRARIGKREGGRELSHTPPSLVSVAMETFISFLTAVGVASLPPHAPIAA